MVSTRHHPSPFPPPTPTRQRHSTSRSPSPRRTLSKAAWSHTPSHLTLIWLLISLPLVLWDTAYVLGRPHTMPGGFLHPYLWKPYALYGTIDYVYGWPAWDAKNGFTAAQGLLNLVETAGYLVYLSVVLEFGESATVHNAGDGEGEGEEEGEEGGKGAPRWFKRVPVLRWLLAPRVLRGRESAWAVLLGFATAVMTLSKTVLYWLNEYFSGFANIGHNDVYNLVVLWIIPNGAWILFPIYMIYVFGGEILDGLEAASFAPAANGESKKEL